MHFSYDVRNNKSQAWFSCRSESSYICLVVKTFEIAFINLRFQARVLWRGLSGEGLLGRVSRPVQTVRGGSRLLRRHLPRQMFQQVISIIAIQLLMIFTTGGGVSAAPGECRSVTASPVAVRSISTSCSEPELTLSPDPAAASDKTRDEESYFTIIRFYNPNIISTLSLHCILVLVLK